VLALSQTVIYMLVVLIEVLQPTAELTVDYLQNEAPAMVIQVEPVLNSDDDVYLVTATTTTLADGGSVTMRIEQTDLYAHNYLVFGTDSPPQVVDLSPIRRQLAGVSMRPGNRQHFDLMLEMTGVAESPVAGEPMASGETAVGAGAGGSLHLLGRPPYLLLTAPAGAVVLIAR
jgi:hypothetical protein